jgi:putative ABC transport system permease protein
MGRLAWWQARFRPARTLALIVGLLVAATAFTVLTAASRTAQLRTTGTVSANFSPAYDILVRPKGARTAQENRTGTVQPDVLSGIYGGITMAQYHRIQRIPGVQVANAQDHHAGYFSGFCIGSALDRARNGHSILRRSPQVE